MLIGFLVFISLFLFPPFDNPSSAPIRMGVAALLLFGGGVVRFIGGAGLAGSGAILDPEQARRDLEPYSRQVGGMLKDTLDEADINLGSSASPIIMIKCRSCSALSHEHARFCQGCGTAL
jgi:hypothetical protein